MQNRGDLLWGVTGSSPKIKSSARINMALEVHTQMEHRCQRMRLSQLQKCSEEKRVRKIINMRKIMRFIGAVGEPTQWNCLVSFNLTFKEQVTLRIFEISGKKPKHANKVGAGMQRCCVICYDCERHFWVPISVYDPNLITETAI